MASLELREAERKMRKILLSLTLIRRRKQRIVIRNGCIPNKHTVQSPPDTIIMRRRLGVRFSKGVVLQVKPGEKGCEPRGIFKLWMVVCSQGKAWL